MPHATNTTTIPHPEEDELHLSLQEALTCTTCAITHIPKTIFHRDLTKGVYNKARNPPFKLIGGSWTEREREREVAPEEIPIPSPSPHSQHSPSYEHNHNRDHNHDDDNNDKGTISTHLTTPHLLTTYQTLLQTYLTHDPERDESFAHYLMDYHIHVHYLLRRGVLGFCRDVKDVYEMKAWRGKVHEIDHSGVGVGVGVGWQQPARSRTGWVDDANLLMVYQMALWRKRGLVRQKKVEENRARWAGIMEERRRQRRKQRSVRVRLYCSQAGDRCFLREVVDEVGLGEKIRYGVAVGWRPEGS
ncbi:hypothetical protein BO78DRAFT_419021 [Aspergillus sclerotiicarbonarius CBS 121057]|uniref:Uncharacterized protein n=1 Tax=Aspergillus sclerotiicarbonarius (strain CBS 121057 / IBT 28362) TaxID=1448318 RepID=A0A319E7L1_ASPSB|nr:hypothetical protein BO78DRAFT_419021 [Aspergillus sclerotiicarbonarius CBS 121057]